MASILGIGSALPPHCADNDEIIAAASEWLTSVPSELATFTRFLEHSQTKLRHFVVPPSKIIEISGPAEKSALFEAHAPALAINAAQRALQAAKTEAEEIGAIIFTSCSVPTIPALDTFVIDALELPRTILRIPAYQFGCAGGVIGIRLASELISPKIRKVLLISCELCSLVFQPRNYSPAHLVGAAIFGDGAAAIVLGAGQGKLEILGHNSYLIPETRELMGYDILNDGAHLRLRRELPARLIEELPRLTTVFLKEHNLSTVQIPWWLFHPGGAKILDLLEETFDAPADRCPWSREVLSEVGNISSATVLFVVERFLSAKRAAKGEHVLLAGVGPGLTIEQALFTVG